MNLKATIERAKRQGRDPYVEVACEMFHCEPDEVTDGMRRYAKDTAIRLCYNAEISIDGIEKDFVLWTYKGIEGTSLTHDGEVLDAFTCDDEISLSPHVYTSIKFMVKEWLNERRS